MPRIEATEVRPGIYAPLITIELTTQNGTKASSLALVDSGADATIFPAEMMEAVGIEWDSLALGPSQGMGVGGQFEIRICRNVVLKWRKWDFAQEFQVAEAGKLPGPLLGREGFFERFTIRFSWNRNPPTVDIDPIT